MPGHPVQHVAAGEHQVLAPLAPGDLIPGHRGRHGRTAAGATTPTGAPCLGTAALGTQLQVTYHKLRLYMFVNDTGHSVTGNGVAGFHVAKVTAACTAAH